MPPINSNSCTSIKYQRQKNPKGTNEKAGTKARQCWRMVTDPCPSLLTPIIEGFMQWRHKHVWQPPRCSLHTAPGKTGWAGQEHTPFPCSLFCSFRIQDFYMTFSSFQPNRRSCFAKITAQMDSIFQKDTTAHTELRHIITYRICLNTCWSWESLHINSPWMALEVTGPGSPAQASQQLSSKRSLHFPLWHLAQSYRRALMTLTEKQNDLSSAMRSGVPAILIP